MNPFAGMLQMPAQRPLEGTATTGEILRQLQEQKQLKQRQLENTQQNTIATRGANRADAELALQQGEQTHRFGIQDQKQVEDALSEYHDAVDTGDPVRIQRATALLKRFGMDVAQASAPAAATKPDLRALTGQKLLPSVASPETDLSQSDFEDKLINQKLPSSENVEHLEGNQSVTDPGYLAQVRQATGTPEETSEGESPGVIDLDKDNPAPLQIGRKSEVTSLSPQQEAQFQAWARQNGIRDVNSPDAHYDYRGFFLATKGAPHPPGSQLHFPDTFKQHGHPTFSVESKYSSGPGDGGSWNGETFIPAKEQASEAPQAAASLPPRLPGLGLPTVISKGGKVLEEDSGQQGRYSPMVAAAFEPFTQHENPEVASAAKQAQQMTAQLVKTDGIPPAKAIQFGLEWFKEEANRINNLERTKIGSKAHLAGIPGATPTFNPKARQFFTNEMHESVQKFKNENIETGIRGYDSALTALNSSNPASQNDAINQLIAARSGKTVSDRERAIYDNISGVWNGIQKKYNMAAGNPMPEEVKGQIRALLADAKSAVVQAREERARAAEAYHRAKLRGANPGDVDADSKAVAEAIRMGSGGDDNSDLWQ